MNSSDFKNIWSQALEFLKENIKDPQTFTVWIEPIVPVSISNGMALLGVKDEFTVQWMEHHFSEIISNCIQKACKDISKIHFESGHEPPRNEKKIMKPIADFVKVKTATPCCNATYTFSNFVVGPENRIAYAAAMGMVDPKASALAANPLFIYSNPGLGKTHLAHALANEVMRRDPSSKIELTTCENLLNEYISSLMSKMPNSFRNHFRKVNYLLVDDIHFIAKKPSSQEEFFNTFNELYNDNNKIILTSDKKPSEIQGLEARLVSRFSSGLTVEIEPFGEETKFAILKMKQEAYKVKFCDDILELIAENLPSDVRVLESALRRLAIHSSINKEYTISLQKAKDILKDYLERENVKKISIESIQKTVAEFFDLRVSDLSGAKRSNNIVVPRMMAMYLSRKITQKSLPEIGEAFGNRSHATVIHAIKKIDSDKTKNENVSRIISQIERKLKSV